MTLKPGARLLLCLATLVAVPSAASAQMADLGSRAQGMGGAFVAVADDPSAVYWNPAGLGGALVVGAVFDVSRQRAQPVDGPFEAPNGAEATRFDGRLFAAALPPLGVSYYSLRYAGARGTAAGGPDGRQVESRDVAFRSLETRHFGLTLVQSLTDAVVLGTTIRFVRAGVGFGEGARGESWPDLADEAADLDTSGENTVDLDAGLMVSAGSVRLGLVVRNLREPAFTAGSGGEPLTLARHARVGVAYGAGWPGGQSPLVVSVDADLTRTTVVGPERRDVAAGVEGWTLGRRLGLRGGMRASTVGDARPVGTLGLSLGVTAAMFVDAHVARGRHGDRAWSVGGRIFY